MRLLLYPRAVEGTKIQVWLGLTQCTDSPPLSWTLDGQPRTPNFKTPLQPVRNPQLVQNANMPRVWSGVYEFHNLSPGQVYSVGVTVENNGNPSTRTLAVRTLPDRVSEEGFHILLCSCFHAAEASPGALSYAVGDLIRLCGHDANGHQKMRRPDISLLMGDQVYLDLPTFEDFPLDKVRLAAKFEDKYLRNWRGDKRFDSILAAAPFGASADDHEFWNNFPHFSPIIENSATKKGRENWRKAAEAVFDGFQVPHPQGRGRGVSFNVPPVSILVLDTRTQRKEKNGKKTFMNSALLTDLDNWVNKINENRWTGVLVTGQSLYAKAASKFEGWSADWELPNYDDFTNVVKILNRVTTRLICVTGDVHWGRVVRSKTSNPQRPDGFEVIVSPAALVTTVGKDAVAEGWNWFKGIFGKDEPWPRHSDAEEEIEKGMNPFLRSKTFVRHRLMEDGDQKKATLRGNQIGLLSFWMEGSKLRARVRYWSLNMSSGPSLQVTLF